MSGIEKITNRIAYEAEQKVKEIRQKSESEEAAILETAGADAAQKADAAILSAKDKAAQVEKRMVSVGELEARKLQLGIKQEVIDICFEKALDKLCAMDKEQYTDMLMGLAVGMINEDMEIMLNPKDKTTIGNDLVNKINGIAGKWKITLAQDTIEARGGFVLRSGNVETNCRLEMLVKSKREELAPLAAAILFG